MDLMVKIASRQEGIYGARMTGGGFGGCTINLVASDQAEEFKRMVAEEHAKSTGIAPDIYICRASDGVGAAAPE